MPRRSANLLLNQIKIIQQPLSRRRNLPPQLNRLGQLIAGVNNHVFIVSQARQQLITIRLLGQTMRTSQNTSVLLHLQSAKQFRPKRQLFTQSFTPRSAEQQIGGEIKNAFGNGRFGCFQCGRRFLIRTDEALMRAGKGAGQACLDMHSISTIAWEVHLTAVFMACLCAGALRLCWLMCFWLMLEFENVFSIAS
jgi:hypothetical protein